MQTAQIKVGGVYAYRRGEGFVRFKVHAVITRKAADVTKSTIEGFIAEDRKDGTQPPTMLKIDPADLVGPYDQNAELVKRQEQEEADKKAAELVKNKQAQQDRLMLYAFIGETPPKDVKEYHQLFRVTFGSVDFTNAGQRQLIERIRMLTVK